jgi:hypothetical protein
MNEKNNYKLNVGGHFMPGHKNKGLKTAVQTKIPLISTTTDVAGKHIVRGNLELAKMNNRLYRHARNYEFQFQTHPSSAEADRIKIDFYTLPDTWFVRGAIKHAYNTYMQSMADELNAGIKMAKWHDFMINEQNPDGSWDYMGGCLYDGDGFAGTSADETITDSSVTDSGGTSKSFNLMGAISNQYNIFSEYAKLLNYRKPTDEAVSSDQPYDGLLDLKDADVLAERGDKAPYDRDFSSFLPDGDGDDQNILVLQDSLFFESDSNQGRMTTRRFTAPLGLVWIEKFDNGSLADFSNSTPYLSMIAAPGDYKGVKAPSLV